MDQQEAVNTTTGSRTLSKVLAPEDIRPEYYVAVLYVIGEFLPFAAIEEAHWRPVEPVRVQLMPWHTSHPMKVIEVCLPYVLVRDTDGQCRTLDVRKVRLARVTRRFGSRVFELARSRRRNRKSDRDDDDDDDD